MNFTDALMTVELVLESGGVPLLVGESGIGKTSLVKELSKIKNYPCVIIDGNMLKEGEIGGLPTIEEYITIVNGEEVRKKKTVYAVHTKLLEIEDIFEKNPKAEVILFIDEINRCEHSVQQELMNIILNREINGYRLNKNVKIIGAMNPSNKYEEFRESDYQIVDMDPAQENRFVWIEIESDVKTWINWAIEKGKIDDLVLEFISSFPEYIHTPYSKDSVKATPRSWERVSDTYKVYKANKHRIPKKIFFNAVKGNVGNSIAQDFYSFLENYKNPMIKPQEIFIEENISEELIDRIKNENYSRLYLIAKNALIYIQNDRNDERTIDIFSKFIQFYPPDLKIGIMREIKEIYKDSLYKCFIKNETFVEGYFNM